MTKCCICSDPRVDEMEAAYLAGLSDPDIGNKFGISERTWRSHKSHSTRLKAGSNASVQQAKPTLLAALDSLHLSSEEIRLLNILHMRQGIERLAIIASQTGSVRAESALAESCLKLAKLLEGIDF